MKFIGKSGIAYLLMMMVVGTASLATVQATPIAFRIHGETIVANEVPVEEPLSKAEKKALKKEKRAEKRAARAALAAEQAANSLNRAGWRNVFIPGYGYQRVYVDSFGYPTHDALGRPLFAGSFANPYLYRRAPRRVIVVPRCRTGS